MAGESGDGHLRQDQVPLGLIFAVVFLMACQAHAAGQQGRHDRVGPADPDHLIQMAFTDLVIVSLFWWTLRVDSWADVRRWALWVPQLFAMMLATSCWRTLLEHRRRRRDAQHRSDRHARHRGRHEGEGAPARPPRDAIRLLLTPHTTSPPANAALPPNRAQIAVDTWTVGALVYTLIGVALYMLNDVEFSAIGFLASSPTCTPASWSASCSAPHRR